MFKVLAAVGLLFIAASILLQVYRLVQTWKRDSVVKRVIRGLGICAFSLCFIIATTITIYLFMTERWLTYYCMDNQHAALEYPEWTLYLGDIIHKTEDIMGQSEIALNSDVALRLCLAKKMARKGDSARAIDEYLMVLKRKDNNYTARRDVADLLFSVQKYDQAIYHYRRLTEMQPAELSWTYYFDMGRAFLVLQDSDKAIANFEKALEYGANDQGITAYLHRAKQLKERKLLESREVVH